MTDTPNNAPASPDEEPTAEEVAAAGQMRPLEELPSPWTVKGNPPMLSEPTIAALSPADRETVLERAGSSDPDAITEALHGFLRERQQEFRIRCGAGEGATETEREALSQMNQMRLLGEEHARLEAELAEVCDHRTEIDAEGNAVAVPVYVLQGDARTGRQHRLNEIRHELALVAGIQGEAALQRAARADALRIRELERAAYKSSEIKRRAHEIALEDEINAAARTKARFLKDA